MSGQTYSEATSLLTKLSKSAGNCLFDIVHNVDLYTRKRGKEEEKFYVQKGQMYTMLCANQTCLFAPSTSPSAACFKTAYPTLSDGMHQKVFARSSPIIPRNHTCHSTSKAPLSPALWWKTTRRSNWNQTTTKRKVCASPMPYEGVACCLKSFCINATSCRSRSLRSAHTV